MNTRLALEASVLVLAAAFTPLGNPRAADAPAAAAGVTLPVHLQATVYEVQIPTNRIGRLEAQTLAGSASTAEKLLQTLSAMGSARALYRVDQPVNVYAERIVVGSSNPIVTAVRNSPTGDPLKSVTYVQTGVMISLSAEPPPAQAANRKNPVISMQVQLSALSPSDTDLGPGVKATVTRTVSIEHHETLEYGKPRVMLSVDSTQESLPPAGYVIRYVFTKP